MGDALLLNLEFELSSRKGIFGAIQTRRIGVRAYAERIRGWLPFGPGNEMY